MLGIPTGLKDAKTKELEEKLIRSGLSRDAIRAAWPTWWSDDAAGSPSAFNDLKFSLSRKLGIAPTSMFDEGDAVFVWHGNAKFKGLDVQTEAERQAFIGYATAVSKLIMSCSNFPSTKELERTAPDEIRLQILKLAPFVGLPQLLGLAYSMGVPVLYLRVFPLEAKGMTAMSVKTDDQYLILIGREVRYSAWLSFYVAHELAHIMMGHLRDSGALVDAELQGESTDEEEVQADRFALTLLTGRSEPRFEINRPARTATELAHAVLNVVKETRISPGTLALCYGFATKDWEQANGALKSLYGGGQTLWRDVNEAAVQYFDFSRLTEDNQVFLSKLLGLSNGGTDSAR
jgi:Zn-dependent peptidase ImmA (M78 family)